MTITNGLPVRAALAVATTFTLLAAPASSQKLQPPTEVELAAELADAFRIDLSDVQIELDFHPLEDRVDGSALLTFSMREGQTRALFHFNPARKAGLRKERKFLTALSLNGEELDPQSDADLGKVRGAHKAEWAFEVLRDLDPGETHTLEIEWSMPKAAKSIPKDGAPHPGWLYPIFDDTEGPRKQTETFWPTVSSPEELARHRITLRVHGTELYTLIGSGVVVQTDAGPEPQVWELDTVEAISSSNVFFAAMPTADVLTTEFEVGDVDVVIVTDQSADVLDLAEQISIDAITRLQADFGEFPMPNMHVLLTGWGSGMEYYGATRTGLDALEHEFGHMYFGTTAVNRTWRDTWFDESAVVWWEEHDDDHDHPLKAKFKSKLALDRPAAAPGFHGSAYGSGASILGEVAEALGGDEAMLAFLKDLHERRAFEPFTTEDLIDDIVAAQEVLDRAQLELWLYAKKD